MVILLSHKLFMTCNYNIRNNFREKGERTVFSDPLEKELGISWEEQYWNWKQIKN